MRENRTIKPVVAIIMVLTTAIMTACAGTGNGTTQMLSDKDPEVAETEITGAAESDTSASGTLRLAGRYVCFDEANGNAYACSKGILTVADGVITDISEYEENQPGVEYLREDQVIFPGLLNIHNHAECNMYQLFGDKLNAGAVWDNRFEWRGSANYVDLYKVPNKAIQSQWNESLLKLSGITEPNDSDACSFTVGDMTAWYAELQAVSGGTTLLQEDDNSEEIPFLDNHRKIRMIRSTSDGNDLGRADALPCLSVIQLYTPNHTCDPEDPKTYMPPMDTSDWEINADTAKSIRMELIEHIKAVRTGESMSSTAFLIHVAEGRAGNFSNNADAYSRKELEAFMWEVDKSVSDGFVTVEDVRNADIGLIHACAADLADPEIYNFLQKYDIALIWSPVSNLLLYEDTPDFYNYLNDDGITVCIGSDWTPSGSKTIWDELKFVYKLAVDNLDDKVGNWRHILGINLLKAATVNAADAIGSDRLGNIAVGKLADFMVLDACGEDALESFYALDETNIAMVYVGGEPMYGDRDFYEKHVDGHEKLTLANIPGKVTKLNDKYYNITGKCDADEFIELLETYTKFVEDSGAEVSLLRSSEDAVYLEEMQRLHDKSNK